MASGVEFDEDTSFSRPRPVQSAQNYGAPAGYGGSVPQFAGFNNPGANVHGMAGWLMRHHLAKSEGSAQAILLGLIVFNFIVTAAVLLLFTK